MEEVNYMKAQEENTKILEDSIHENIARTVAKCDELLASGNQEAQQTYTKKMLQPPTKCERIRYASNEH